MDASPGSQSRKGMGFRSWYCGSCGTAGNRPSVYFSGEITLFPFTVDTRHIISASVAVLA